MVKHWYSGLHQLEYIYDLPNFGIHDFNLLQRSVTFAGTPLIVSSLSPTFKEFMFSALVTDLIISITEPIIIQYYKGRVVVV